MIAEIFLDVEVGDLLQMGHVRCAFICAKGRLVNMEGGIGSYHTNSYGEKSILNARGGLLCLKKRLISSV